MTSCSGTTANTVRIQFANTTTNTVANTNTAGVNLFHRSTALDASGFALGAVVPLEIEPAGLVGHRLRILTLARRDWKGIFSSVTLVTS